MFTIHNNNNGIVPIPYKRNHAYISNSGEPVETQWLESFDAYTIPSSVLTGGDTVTGTVKYNRNKTTTDVVMATRSSDATYIITRVQDYIR